MINFLELIRPIITGDLIRIGRNQDGGYVVNKCAVENTTLISLGVNNEWSFESEFRKFSTKNIYMYDGSVGEEIFLSNLFNSILDLFSLRFLLSLFSFKLLMLKKVKLNWMNYFKFRHFIKNEGLYFFQKYISDLPNMTSLTSILSEFSPISERIFLKIDIECHEYRILSDIDKFSDKISGIVIEFHDIDLHYFEFNTIISKLKEKYHITHIHANNYSYVSQKLNNHSAFEITFLNKSYVLEEPINFHSGIYNKQGIDFSNNPDSEDYKIVY